MRNKTLGYAEAINFYADGFKLDSRVKGETCHLDSLISAF